MSCLDPGFVGRCSQGQAPRDERVRAVLTQRPQAGRFLLEAGLRFERYAAYGGMTVACRAMPSPAGSCGGIYPSMMARQFWLKKEEEEPVWGKKREGKGINHEGQVRVWIVHPQVGQRKPETCHAWALNEGCPHGACDWKSCCTRKPSPMKRNC